MRPASPLFQPLDLTPAFNLTRAGLPAGLRAPEDLGPLTGTQIFHGIPFALGAEDGPNVVLLDDEPVAIPLDDAGAENKPPRFIVFLHAVEDRPTNYLEGLADTALDGNELGDHVSDYALEYADGSVATTPIRRRFAVQQSRIGWGASAFEAIPAAEHLVFPTATEEIVLGRVPQNMYGRGETRVASGRDRIRDKLWLYALENPHPDKPLRRLLCTPRDERSVIYGVSLGWVDAHPLRPGVRRKLRLTLPEHISLNRLGECEELAMDLGQVISARAALDYDHARWLAQEPNVQPQPSARDVIVEYAAHPQARLYVGRDPATQRVYELAALSTAYNRLHQRMHAQGVFHDHSAPTDHDEHHDEPHAP